VFIVPDLKKKLLRYVKEHGISTGTVLVTRGGKPVCRHSIWKGMKALCEQANVSPSKVFPHNLRHLFARTFYGIEKDIAKLADILGHASINTTRIYIVTTGAEHKRKMEHMRLII
jgi:site-specific recombinase XerD